MKKKIFLGIGAACIAVFSFFFIGIGSEPEDVFWGVNFSQKHAEYLGLDWKEVYIAILDDLEAKHLKIAVHWDRTEPQKDEFAFQDLDWQVKEAEERGVDLVLVVGMKTPRWPECHLPDWVQGKSKEEQQQEIKELLEAVVLRYKDSPALAMWQVENEPFFAFGNCPWRDDEFVVKEVQLVKSLDSSHPVMISTSGEGAFWTKAAKTGDVVGTTMYREIWFEPLGVYFSYPFPSTFYARKAWLIKTFYGKEVIGVELQAEPWGPILLYDLPREEQVKTMDLEQFRKNVAFAKRTGLKGHYLWGVEWWYLLKERYDDAAIWDEAKKLF